MRAVADHRAQHLHFTSLFVGVLHAQVATNKAGVSGTIRFTGCTCPIALISSSSSRRASVNAFGKLFCLSSSVSICLTQPAYAQDKSEDKGGQPDWIEQAKISAEMGGISVREAVIRAVVQNRALHFMEKAEKNPAFAGAYIDRSGGIFTLVVQRKRGNLLNIATDDAELDKSIIYEEVEFSLGELKSQQMKMAKELHNGGVPASISLDIKSNKLIVQADNVSQAEGLLAIYPENSFSVVSGRLTA